MPTATKSLCQCGAVRDGDRCSRCGRGKQGHAQKTTARGRGHDWQQVSKQSRRDVPLCVPCFAKGRATAASPGSPLHSHHIVKVKHAPHLRLDRDNLLTVCVTCHAELDAMYERDRASYDRLAVELKKVRDEMFG